MLFVILVYNTCHCVVEIEKFTYVIRNCAICWPHQAAYTCMRTYVPRVPYRYRIRIRTCIDDIRMRRMHKVVGFNWNRGSYSSADFTLVVRQ